MPSPLHQNIPDHISVNIGQPIVPASVTPCEAFVIDSHQMQYRGMKIMDMDRLFCRPNSMFIGGTMNVATLYTCPGKP
jgi:hypothetical protein